MIEVTPFELLLIVLGFGGLITYIFHLHHKITFLETAMARMAHAKMSKLDIPDGTVVRIELD